LITGISGQDGSYLAEFLLQKGYEVHGIVRRTSTASYFRIDQLIKDESYAKKLQIHVGDLTDPNFISRIIYTIKPDEVYNLAAQSHVLESFNYPHKTTEVNSLGLLNILESTRIFSPESKIYQASTSELFGSTLPPQNEKSEMKPRSPYAISKFYSYWAIRNYREAYGMFAVNGILFNHESPRRTVDFVTRKITSSAVKIFNKKQSKLFLGNLDAKRDWGYAPEYVVGMWKILQLHKPADLTLSTGRSYTVKDFLSFSFGVLDLDWEKYVEIDNSLMRPTEVESLEGDSSLAKSVINWAPKIYAPDLAEIMTRCDLLMNSVYEIDKQDFSQFE
jgi:GDPmannose 4,6-dehydratase